MNILWGIEFDKTFDLKNEYRSVIYISWSSDFDLYLEDYLMDEGHTLGYQCEITFDLVINVGHSDLYFIVR